MMISTLIITDLEIPRQYRPGILHQFCQSVHCHLCPHERLPHITVGALNGHVTAAESGTPLRVPP